LGSNTLTVASENCKGLTPTLPAACTSACTSGGENANAGTLDAGHQGEGEGPDQGGTARGSSAADQGDPLAVLAAAVANLSPADRARLAAMLAATPAIETVPAASDSSEADQSPDRRSE